MVDSVTAEEYSKCGECYSNDNKKCRVSAVVFYDVGNDTEYREEYAYDEDDDCAVVVLSEVIAQGAFGISHFSTSFLQRTIVLVKLHNSIIAYFV